MKIVWLSVTASNPGILFFVKKIPGHRRGLYYPIGRNSNIAKASGKSHFYYNDSPMNAHSNNPGMPAEDIDLLVLLERTILFFRKHKWLFIIATVLGLGFGYFTWLRLPRVYKSRMILHSFTLSNQDYMQVIDNWNSLLRKGESKTLAASFDVPVSVVSHVNQIKGNEIQKVFTATNPNGFYIDVFVTDNSILPQLQTGILNGLENVEFIKKQVAIKKSNLSQLIVELNREIHKLDSTKSTVEKMLAGKVAYSSSLMIDITGLNRQLIDMNEKLLGYKQDLQFTSAVQLLQGFTAFSRPAGPNLVVWLGLGLLAGLVIAYVIALYLSVKRNLKARMQTQQGNS